MIQNVNFSDELLMNNIGVSEPKYKSYIWDTRLNVINRLVYSLRLFIQPYKEGGWPVKSPQLGGGFYLKIGDLAP